MGKEWPSSDNCSQPAELRGRPFSGWPYCKLEIYRLYDVLTWKRFAVIITADAPVAQLDRASADGSEGWGFDSSRAYFFN